MTHTWSCTQHAGSTLIIDADQNHREWTVPMGQPCLLGRVETPEPGPYRVCNFVEEAAPS